jgi:hypothetical protein
MLKALKKPYVPSSTSSPSKNPKPRAIFFLNLQANFYGLGT